MMAKSKPGADTCVTEPDGLRSVRMIESSNSKGSKLDRAVMPKYLTFAQSCKQGLSVVYPFASADVPDPYGWKFGSGWPPSYSAFGRMRSLMAMDDAIHENPRRVLEVAAGGGGLAAKLTADGCHVVANDLRGDDLRKAINEYRTADRIRLVEGNMFDLSPDNIGKFDLVIACEVIEHVAHPQELLGHLRTFLAPQGRILITTPNGLHFRNKLPTYSDVPDLSKLELRQFMPDADGHLFLFTPQEICDVASTVGLKVERMSVWGMPTLSGHFWMRRLAGRFWIKPAYYFEILAQRLPSAIRQRLCVAMSVILKQAET